MQRIESSSRQGTNDYFADYRNDVGGPISRYDTAANANLSDLPPASLHFSSVANSRDTDRGFALKDHFRIRLARKKGQAARKNKEYMESRAHRLSVAELGQHWRLVKMIKSGGQGSASLWEYSAGEGDPERVVMKFALNPNNDLAEERNIMLQLGQGDHCVHLVHDHLIDNTARHVQRIFMEYCPGGDLHDMISRCRRKRPHMRLSEHTLWHFLDCFRKGLCNMRHGNETSLEPPAGVRNPICHFDIKPLNIFLVRSNGEQFTGLPIAKIGDYGLASEVPTDRPITRPSFRKRGTPGYYTPEQFSRRWDLPNNHHEKWHVCGRYGTASNIWQIALTMYELITFQRAPEPVGFYPNSHLYTDEGRRLIGVTYGKLLAKMPISTTLRDLVWRCLMEMPDNRPELQELEEAITAGINDAVSYGAPRQNWDDLIFDEPPVPDLEPPNRVGSGGGGNGGPPQGAEAPKEAEDKYAGEEDDYHSDSSEDDLSNDDEPTPRVPARAQIKLTYLIPGDDFEEEWYFWTQPEDLVGEFKQTLARKRRINIPVDNQKLKVMGQASPPWLPGRRMRNNNRTMAHYGVVQGSWIRLTDKTKQPEEPQPSY